MNAAYRETVALLLDAMPATFESPHFAMKGGTALKLFFHDMSRLSVDIDVAYTNRALPRAELPGVLWKLQNVRDLKAKNPKKHRAMIDALAATLDK